jgi:methyl-accepting chemotaxis protein
MLNNAVKLSSHISNLVHELQKERGMTAGFLGSKGVKFKDLLPQQREITNKETKIFKYYLKNMDLHKYEKDYNKLIKKAINSLNVLQTKRDLISALNISGKDAISYYTNTNSDFLEIIRSSSKFSPDNGMTRQLTAYINFLLSKERAGVERAIGAITFAADKFAVGMKLKFNKLISEQDAYLDSYTKLANKNNLKFYKEKFQGKVIQEVNRIRNIALLAINEENFGVDSFYWFEIITKKINLLKQIDDFISTDLLLNADELSNKSKSEMILYISISLLIFIISISLGRVISNNIENGVHTLSNGLESFFKFLNKQSDDVNLIEMKRADALGEMSNKINDNIITIKNSIQDDLKFMQEVKNIVSKIKAGYLYQRIEYDVKSKNLIELKIEINEMLEVMNNTIGGNINKITDVLNSYSDLNFKKNIKDSKGKVEVSILNVGQMITKMLQNNKRNGLTIENTSKVLLENVDILNDSSNKAAASLEETAAALEEITSSISNNTQTVIKMSTYASEVTSSVENGQKLANETSKSMDEINEQVAAINDAISIIDQISFQTNILSINAAVEAATAGEAGKGFAVVAQEVRNLASRSSEAANQIKELVENATIKANIGKNISSEMIKGYSSLNNNISQTIELIQDVTDSSKEQQLGIEQINDAVAMLDQQTQQNASVAAQTAQIARETSIIASKIVEDADEKEFEGKESITI